MHVVMNERLHGQDAVGGGGDVSGSWRRNRPSEEKHVLLECLLRDLSFWEAYSSKPSLYGLEDDDDSLWRRISSHGSLSVSDDACSPTRRTIAQQQREAYHCAGRSSGKKDNAGAGSHRGSRNGGGNRSGRSALSSARGDRSGGASEAQKQNWKAAVDPSTGRTYYYNTVTRKTQWEKPAALRAAEKQRKIDKKKREAEFFREMEANIKTSLSRGEVIPGIAPGSVPGKRKQRGPLPWGGRDVDQEATTASCSSGGDGDGSGVDPSGLAASARSGPEEASRDGAAAGPTESKIVTPTTDPLSVLAPVLSPEHMPSCSSSFGAVGPLAALNKPAAVRIRTISAMNEQVLMQLQSSEKKGDPGTQGHSSFALPAKTSTEQFQGHPIKTAPACNNNANNPNQPTDPDAGPDTTGPNGVGSETLSAESHGSFQGRPPLYHHHPPQARRNPTSTQLSQTPQLATLAPPVTGADSNSSGCESGCDDDKSIGNGNMMPSAPFRGELLLDAPKMSDDDDCRQHQLCSLTQPSLPEEEAVTSAAQAMSPSSLLPVSGKPACITNHVRRNTGGTIYLETTMSNPDVQATIFSVAAVYRAHIVQAAQQGQEKSPPTVTAVNMDIFRDVYPGKHESDALGGKKRRTKRRGSKKKVAASVEPEADPEPREANIPTLSTIVQFYEEFYRRSQMEHDTIIMSLIYVERLIKETGGVLTPTAENWQSLLLSCMILASKVWDDLSMWNIDFSHVASVPKTKREAGVGSEGEEKEDSHCPNVIPPFSLQRINQLELAVLTSLNFDVKVAASEYAKYYFLIRTMLKRSGMLGSKDGGKDGDGTRPLNKQQAALLEMRTCHYQDSRVSASPATLSKSLPQGCGSRRTQSVDWSFGSTSAGSSQQQKQKDVHSVGPVLKDNICLEQLVNMNQ